MELHLLRLEYGGRRYYLLAAILLLLSAGCSVVGPNSASSARAKPDYLLTVSLEPSDTKRAVEQRHDGRVVI